MNFEIYLNRYNIEMTEDSTATTENQNTSVKRTAKTATTLKSDPRLPWWVELLFVQIGLPDKWLPALLKQRKSTLIFLLDNSSSIYYSIILIVSLIYIYPLVRQSRLNNNCVDYAARLQEVQNNKATYNENYYKAYKVCNGSQ